MLRTACLRSIARAETGAAMLWTKVLSLATWTVTPAMYRTLALVDTALAERSTFKASDLYEAALAFGAVLWTR